MQPLKKKSVIKSVVYPIRVVVVVFFRNKRGTEGEKVVRAIKCKVKRMKRLRKTALVNLQSGR